MSGCSLSAQKRGKNRELEGTVSETAKRRRSFTRLLGERDHLLAPNGCGSLPDPGEPVVPPPPAHRSRNFMPVLEAFCRKFPPFGFVGF